jgi:transposase
MARYKPVSYDQDKFIPIAYRDQILPGTFEHTLCDVIDDHVDLTVFDARYANDDTGRLAYPPAVLLKIVLYGYYKGILSMERRRATPNHTKPHRTQSTNQDSTRRTGA